MSIQLADFHPLSRWQIETNGQKFCDGTPAWIRDVTANRLYGNDDQDVIRMKCLACAIVSPLVHPIAALVQVVCRSVKLLFGVHFWPEAGTKYHFTARLADAGKDLLRIVATPLALVGIELAAIYGLCRPHDGRKLYATLERAIYGHFIIAPCFQPHFCTHAFGGNPTERNAW